MLHATCIIVSRNKEVNIIENKSRADYFRKRRETTKQFNVAVDRNKMEQFEKKLEIVSKTKKTWLEEKIDEELKK